ncbi:hypothetical protein M139_4948 [Bacteroides fragilis str. S23L24]|nr:hypothetical protein M139_4948 [Bacteroides fragilis str. S23L24]
MFRTGTRKYMIKTIRKIFYSDYPADVQWNIRFYSLFRRTGIRFVL